jgi:lipid II:glycine glycyltransferase (peptidoglycan interpeptide bridge formation enzyme)
VGAIILSFFGGVATYLHGASSDEHRNLMANYFLQWEAIKRAKEKGMKKYDFFGIAVELNRKKWAGITRFKKGFCPDCEPIIFPGCYDLVLCPGKYFVYRILQFFK